jgi:hypothetical protein
MGGLVARFPVGKMLEAPVMHLLVPARVFGVAGQPPRQHGGDERLVVRPPEFHVMPVLGHGPAAQIAEIEQAAELLIPAARPHPVQDGATQLNELVVSALLGFAQDEPGAFQRVPWIQRAPLTGSSRVAWAGRVMGVSAVIHSRPGCVAWPRRLR